MAEEACLLLFAAPSVADNCVSYCLQLKWHLQMWLNNRVSCCLQLQPWPSNHVSCSLQLRPWLNNRVSCWLQLQPWLTTVSPIFHSSNGGLRWLTIVLAMQYVLHRLVARVAGLPSGSFTTTEACGDVGIQHDWAWLPVDEEAKGASRTPLKPAANARSSP